MNSIEKITNLMIIDDATNMGDKSTDFTPINPRKFISFISTNATRTIIIVAIVTDSLTARKHHRMNVVVNFNGGGESALDMKKRVAMDTTDETRETDSFITQSANQMLVIGVSIEEEEGVGVVVYGDEGEGGASGGDGERAGEAVEGWAASGGGGASGAVEEAGGAEEESGNRRVGEFL